jgi:hypothetical protein
VAAQEDENHATQVRSALLYQGTTEVVPIKGTAKDGLLESA